MSGSADGVMQIDPFPPVGADDARWTLLLTHGAGAPADSPLLTGLSHALSERGVRVLRFEFPYMAARRSGAARRPPDRAAVLLSSWREQVLRAREDAQLLAIGGHSMGGRYATMLAAEADAPSIDAVVAIGYPFKPPYADQPRTAHLANVQPPLLIVQGERDPFGDRQAVGEWELPGWIRFAWIGDGDHSLVPRRASGRTRESNYDAAAQAITEFLGDVADGRVPRSGQ